MVGRAREIAVREIEGLIALLLVGHRQPFGGFDECVQLVVVGEFCHFYVLFLGRPLLAGEGMCFGLILLMTLGSHPFSFPNCLFDFVRNISSVILDGIYAACRGIDGI